jgi:hypothetical protein
MKRKRRTNVGETQIVVDCPAWIQRTMIHNLQEAARSRNNKEDAQKAKNILAAIEGKCDLVGTLTPIQDDATPITAHNRKAAQQAARSKRSEIPVYDKAFFGRCKKLASVFIKGAGFRKFVYGG